MTTANARRLAGLSPEQRREVLQGLSAEDLQALAYEWRSGLGTISYHPHRGSFGRHGAHGCCSGAVAAARHDPQPNGCEQRPRVAGDDWPGFSVRHPTRCVARWWRAAPACWPSRHLETGRSMNRQRGVSSTAMDASCICSAPRNRTGSAVLISTAYGLTNWPLCRTPASAGIWR